MDTTNSYFILKNERPDKRFDAQLEGILVDNENEIIPSPFNFGEPVKNEKKYFIKILNQKSEPGKFRDKLPVNIQNRNALFVVNNKAEQVLRDFGKGIEFHDLTIKNGKEINVDYKIVNIIDVVNCINHQDSTLIYWEPTQDTVYNIDHLVLKEDVIPNQLNIFLLGEIRGTVIIVHKRLKDAIAEQKITGFSFHAVDDFVL